MDNLTYFIEAIHLQLEAEPEAEPEAGLMLWSQVFDQARDTWQLTLCRRLLREIRATTLPVPLNLPAIILTRSAEGMWLTQLEQWSEAVASYEKGLVAARQKRSRELKRQLNPDGG